MATGHAMGTRPPCTDREAGEKTARRWPVPGNVECKLGLHQRIARDCERRRLRWQAERLEAPVPRGGVVNDGQDASCEGAFRSPRTRFCRSSRGASSLGVTGREVIIVILDRLGLPAEPVLHVTEAVMHGSPPLALHYYNSTTAPVAFAPVVGPNSRPQIPFGITARITGTNVYHPRIGPP